MSISQDSLLRHVSSTTPTSWTQHSLAPSISWASSRWLTILSHYYDRQILLLSSGWWELNSATLGGPLPRLSEASCMQIFMLPSRIPPWQPTFYGVDIMEETMTTKANVWHTSAFSNTGKNRIWRSKWGYRHGSSSQQWKESTHNHLCALRKV